MSNKSKKRPAKQTKSSRKPTFKEIVVWLEGALKYEQERYYEFRELVKGDKQMEKAVSAQIIHFSFSLIGQLMLMNRSNPYWENLNSDLQGGVSLPDLDDLKQNGRDSIQMYWLPNIKEDFEKFLDYPGIPPDDHARKAYLSFLHQAIYMYSMANLQLEEDIEDYANHERILNDPRQKRDMRILAALWKILRNLSCANIHAILSLRARSRFHHA